MSARSGRNEEGSGTSSILVYCIEPFGTPRRIRFVQPIRSSKASVLFVRPVVHVGVFEQCQGCLDHARDANEEQAAEKSLLESSEQ